MSWGSRKYSALDLSTWCEKDNLKLHILDRDIFVYGQHYFGNWPIMFYDDPQGPASRAAAMLYNNWVIGIHAKIYRFKELLLWKVDTDGYYTSSTNKYLVYGNNIDLGDKNITNEMEALKGD